MERFLSTRNLHAHYIRGIQEYLHKNNIGVGLPHICIAAEGLYENTILHLRYNNIVYWRTRDRKNDVGFTWMEGQHDTRRHLLENKKIPAWSKSHNPRLYHECIHSRKGTYHMSPRRDAPSLESCYYYKQIYKFTFIA
ncbi:unnamed protein product [Eruca vesicaria subsp. sativa]|uniref:Uncharacterized protein n=1 Tax=Eruca vesicaria subsp. sativa TaxID=29727 RepID=A0ABC8M1X5_ERUVS|nr:unnamed protein product [Eruca vesicaria subsp. sativa]